MTYLELLTALDIICNQEEEVKDTIFEGVNQFDEIKEFDLKTFEKLLDK